jgi:glycosyltransferase involved in cell wall biosynthesis
MSRAPLRVAAITSGRHLPAARFRVRQLIGALAQHGVALHELVPAVSSFPPAASWRRPIWGGLALGARIPLTVATHRYDMTLLQREMLSTLVTLEGFTRKPRVFDVDDAIFLSRGGRTAERIARMSDSVICGNAFLADWFRRRHSQVSVIPTAVDTDRYRPRAGAADVERPVIGWMGTASNLKYLYAIEAALRAALTHCKRSRFLVVSNERPQFRSLPENRVEFRRWAEERELGDLQDMTIGIMPLEDSPWARGKCSFKMLLYMACGLPVVASHVGVNAEIFGLGGAGIPASNESQWVDALIALLDDAGTRTSMGSVGRRIAEGDFSVRVIAPRLAKHLLSVAGSRA